MKSPAALLDRGGNSPGGVLPAAGGFLGE